MKKFICSVCGYIYDEAAGIPTGDRAGDQWEELPGLGSVRYAALQNLPFVKKKEEGAKAVSQEPAGKPAKAAEELRELSFVKRGVFDPASSVRSSTAEESIFTAGRLF